MIMLSFCLAGIAFSMLFGLVAPHYAPAAGTMGTLYAIIGLLAAFITSREEI